jgi:hypothetical protein
VAANHLDTITINIALDPAPVVGTDFGAILIIADEANGTTLNGDRVRTYQSLSAVQADQTAGFISAGVLAGATAAFSQDRQPSSLKIGRRDSGGGESYTDALTAIEAVDPAFYAIAIESRTAADQLLVSAAVEASDTRRLFFMQSADVDFLTSGFPAALAALDGNERTIVCYHDTATEWYDVAYPANRLAFDVDAQSVPWALFTLKGVAVYASVAAGTLTDSQKLNLRANKANPGLGYSSAAQFAPYSGVNANNRPIYEVLTADWFESRLRDATVATVLQAHNAGRKIPVTPEGQTIMGALVGAQFQIGATAGHFVTGQTEVTYPVITDADRTSQLIRVTGRGQLVVSGINFDYDLVFTRDPIFE